MKYIFSFIFFLTVFFFGCDNSGSNTTKINIYLQGNNSSQRIIKNRTLQENIHSVDVSVYIGSPDGNGSLVVKKTYDSSVQIAIIETQSGPGRVVLVQAFNAVGDLLYRGESAVLDLQPGMTEDIQIAMSIVSPPEPRTYEIAITNNFDYSLVVGGVLHVSTFQADASIFEGDIRDIYITCDSIKTSEIGSISPTSTTVNVETSENTYNFIVLWGLDIDGNISYAGAATISGNTPPSGVEIHSCYGDWDEDPATIDTLHKNCVCTTK